METALAGVLPLRVTQCGTEKCASGHQFGPFVRDCYLIHYIFSGCGTYFYHGKAYPLHAGQGFLIFPDEVTTYRASEETPWHYGWIGYTGDAAAALTSETGFSREAPVFTLSEPQKARRILEELIPELSRLRMGELNASGGLLRLLALTGESLHPSGKAETPPASSVYFQKAVWYIEGNLFSPVRVSEVADFVGLCRSQLFRIFREVANCSPQEWIQRARLRRAEALMLDVRLSLREIACSSGYTELTQMDAVFKRFYGQTPGAYRKQLLERQARHLPGSN